MKSHELAMILLSKPDVELVVQKDSEGNGYSPLSGIDYDVVYVAQNTWSGECYDTRWSAEDADMDEDEWEELKSKHAGFAMLCPVN